MQKMGRYTNKSCFKERRRELRRNRTIAESILWNFIRAKRLDGNTKFRRQYNIGCYIVDFYCHELKLIIEIDGDIHCYTHENDKVRENLLKQKGYRVIRYTNEQIIKNTEGVLYNLIQNI